MKKTNRIDGVIVTPLKKIPDERGCIFHMLRCDDPAFEKFGEIYFSMVYPGAIKGWHLHKKMTLNYAVIQGMVKLVLYDDRVKSPTKGNLTELFAGEENYVRIKIPSGIWSGLKGIGTKPALLANCATHPHDPDDMIRLNPFSKKIPYCWDLIHQ